MQIVNLSVFKITSKHGGGATSLALQTQVEIKHCTRASALILSVVNEKIQYTAS